jgi:low affinity Fe/Cu permease
LSNGPSKSEPKIGGFRRFAHAAAEFAGCPASFFSALGLITLWIVSGPLFRFSDTWQLVINTATTVITFLMVFLIQNTQNRDAKAIHLKLDELIYHVKGARNSLVSLENLSDDELQKLQKQFELLHERSVRKESNATETD